MKKSVLFLVVMFTTLLLQAQIVSQNFDSYTAGAKAAFTMGSPWTTWSGTTNGAEDPVFSSTQSSSPSNSVYIATTSNDFVLNLGDLTTGRYKISFKIFVETGKVGYFNILNDFAGTNSIWAMQAYFRPTGMVSVDAGAALVDSMAYTINAWNDIVFIVDLDDDFATMYVNGTELTSWVFSSGSYGDGTTHKLDAMNFYGWSITGYGPGYYIDDVIVSSVTAPNPPMNLTAVLNGANIDLNWTAPSSGTPTSYTLVANNAPLVSGLTGLTYTHANVYPRTYEYVAKAHYAGDGYSHSSNTATVTVPGGVDRNLVLFEIITGTWCTYCPGAAMGAEDMTDAGYDVAIIEYHSGDTYETPNVTMRNDYYNPGGIPFSAADGYYTMEGGSATVSLFPSYQQMYNLRNVVPAVERMYLNVQNVSGDNYQATVSIKQTNAYFPSGLILYTALTESGIQESWQNQSELHFVCRGLYPDGNGTALNFVPNDSLTYTFNFSTTGYVKDNCEFVAFVQHDPSMEIVQVAKVDMSTVSGLRDEEAASLGVYPNPASDYVRVISEETGMVEIFDVAGQLVISQELNQADQLINISALSQGLYTLRVSNGSQISTTKLVVK